MDRAAISLSAPAVIDKKAQQYGEDRAEFRYLATQTLTVYSKQVDQVRKSLAKLVSW